MLHQFSLVITDHLFQTQLLIRTNLLTSEIHGSIINVQKDAINNNSNFSEFQRGVTAKLSDIHDAVVVKPEAANHKNSLVGVTSTLLIAEPNTHCHLDSNQVGGLNHLCIHIQYLTSVSGVLSAGESPPPPPRACFGRDELVEKVISLTENLTPLALIGPGGIGKTSIILTVLHHDSVKKRFGDNRRFIRCDQFPATQSHLLNQLSKVVGAGVENPKDLIPLRPFLSSKEMIICLDNAESILDSEGENEDVYGVVKELSQFSNICLCITSRITTIPTACKTIDVPTLSMEAAHSAFYGIYENGDRESGQVSSILEQLDFHPLSVTLLATVAHHSKWSTKRLTKEWERKWTDVLHTHHDGSLAATIELSLGSPMFQKLGPDARELLGVIAFLPQGVHEDHIDRLFPTFSDRENIFDNFTILSLTYRSNGYITMLAPLRKYLCPKDPTLSPLLLATRDHYFSWLAVNVDPREPFFDEAQWIVLEDVNVEHLLDVFTSADPNSASIWKTCCRFLTHLYWHKPRLVMLGPKIEGLPDNHQSKPQCLVDLSRSFESVENDAERKRLLVHALRLWRKQGDELMAAQTLGFLSSCNARLGLHKEGIEQAKEAVEARKRLDDVVGQGVALCKLSQLLKTSNQLDSAEEVALQAIDLLSDGADQFTVCKCYYILGGISYSKGETEKALNHFEAVLRIAADFNWHNSLFWAYCSMAEVFFKENKFEDAHAHIEQAKPHAINDPYHLGQAEEQQAKFWYKQHKFEKAESKAVCAANIYKKIGATDAMKRCQAFLQQIDVAINDQVASH